MKITFAAYEHNAIGFPGVKLKWTVENGDVTDAYVTIRGVITQPWTWHNPHPLPFIESECAHFNRWVRSQFSEDTTVQG